MKPWLVCTLAGLISATAQRACAGSEPPTGPTTETALRYPVSSLLPNHAPRPQPIVNPASSDPAAAMRGMEDFIAFNCVGCHASNGGGGMGPSLSDAKWLYGAAPAQIFSSIYQGRPNGMPAWGGALPSSTIWDLVAYIQGLAERPGPHYGKTVSRNPQQPQQQQVPAEFVTTTQPWRHMQPFGDGQKPEGP